MLSILIFFMIFVGVTISIYQVYDIHYNLNFDDEEKTPHVEDRELNDLSLKAKEYSETGKPHGFIQAVQNIFGDGFNHRTLLHVFSEEKEHVYAKPLLRRKKNIVCDGRIKVRHLPFLQTSPPTKDIRGGLLVIVVANCLLALFFGGMSVYTTAYEVSVGYLSWFNNEFILMLLILLLVSVTYFISKFDMYMHDIYQIGKLNDLCAAQDNQQA
ncbi:hypothetical protein GCM10027040_30360 [Halomonas shantousis]